MRQTLFSFIIGIGLTNSLSLSAQCIVAGSNFDTSTGLCCPTLDSDETGWYDENLNWDDLCTTDKFIGVENVKQLGLGGVFSTNCSNDFNDVDDIFHLGYLGADGSSAQYGKATVTAQPKFVHSFCQANNIPNNMFVNVGSAPKCPILSYTVYGLAPGTQATLEFTLYNLFDKTYFKHLVDNVCQQPSPTLMSFISKYTYDTREGIKGNALEFSVASNDKEITFNTSYNNEIQVDATDATTKTVAHGASTTVTHTATVPASGSLTFYFYRSSDCFQIPIGIDDIKVSGEPKPTIISPGNPCPMMDLAVKTKQNYPADTKYSWKASAPDTTATSKVFYFIPKEAEKEYSITCEVTLPGCTPSKSDVHKITSIRCCENEGAPSGKTNLFFDDFGNFPSDDTYEWTDRMGVIHTEKIPTGQVHSAQSHAGAPKIPYVRAYNIESSGATLAVPALADHPKRKDCDNQPATELYCHGVYAISKYGGYPGGVKEDNSGTGTGGMLQFDLFDDGSQDNFFKIDIDNICVGKEIEYGAAFASISDNPGSIEVHLEYNGNVIPGTEESKDFRNGEEGWKEIKNSFTLSSGDVVGSTANGVTVSLVVKHNDVIYGQTRDYAIDDIFFKVCSPPDVNVESSLSEEQLLDLCTEDVLTLKSITSESVKRFYLYSRGSLDPAKKIGYVYQYTFDDPSKESSTNKITWKTIHKEAEVLESETFDVEVEKYYDEIFKELADDPNHEKRVYFRVVVGEKSELETDTEWMDLSAFSPCRKISISTIPIIAALNCAACSHLDFENTGVTFTADNVALTKKVVKLCEGESVEIGIKDDVSGKDKDDKIYHGYIVDWYEGSVSGTAKKNKKCTDADYDAPTINVSYNDVEAAGAAGVKYIISFHDYFENETGSTPCDMTDTITVIANPTPSGTLAPEEFCEGTLGNNEPTKTIAGLTGASIVWYDADTTATTSFSIIPEPVVKDLTVAAGSTNRTESFYYVLVSDDGCRSGIQTYDVTVNKADRFPIADKTSFEYKKVEFGTSEWGSLKANKPTLFASMSSANKYYYGDITGANTESEPDLATATLGTESETVPTPTVADKDDPDPEYLWYWAYMVDGNGCHSDTVRLEAIIQGAPMPTPHNDVYCINTPDADVKTIDQYAETNPVDATGVTLNFYKDKAKTQPISAPSTFKPDMTQAGPQDYWVTQSSATSGESAPAKITITVYDVPAVTLANPSAVYCLNETPTVSLEDEVTNAASPYVLELFKGTEPTTGVPPATAAPSTMAITDDTKGQTDYFARFQLEISEPAESITKYCYGDATKYTVDVQSVDKPTGSGYIQYLKDDLASSPKLPTLQDHSAIVFDPSYTPQWYDENMVPISESQAIPPYNAAATTDKSYTFYVTQKSAKPCESDPLEVTIVVSATPMPVPTPLFLCDGVSYPANLDAYAAINPATVGNFELRWFETGADGKADLTANSGDGFASITLSPTIQKTEVVGGVQKEITEYTYWVLQREIGNPGNKSSAAPVKVTVYANPQLVANPPAVKCKGETINLKDMFTCDVDNVTGTWYQSGSSSAISDYQHVGESGVYDMVGEYTKDGVTCKSNTASVTLKFHDYSVSTDGSHTTCPGVSVDDITAVVDINDNSVDPSDLIYSWSTDFNSETGSTNQFSTTSFGLENEGTVGNVKLEVTTAACTASMAAHKATHDITVGKGILDGSISFSERDNSKTLSKSISDAGIAFPSCGGSVAVKLENVKDEDNTNHKFTYAKTSGGSPVDGKFDASGNASLDLEAGKYVVEFTNKCPTKFEFEIIDMHNTADEEHTNNLSICEGEDWYAKIIDIQGPAPDKIEWYLDNTLITGASSDKHQLSPSAQIAHSGVYSYKLYSAGCVFDGKIARGAPLKVKPYAKFKSGINTHYEIVYGEPVTMDVDFDVPSNVSDIVSSVKWNDRNVGFSESGSAQVSISPVEQDYHLTVVADEREADFCKAEINIDVLVDANLDIEAHFEKNIMCVGDEMFLYVDTSGTTGNVLHPANMNLHVVEGSASRPVAYSEKYKAYGVVVSPSTTTQYSVVYTYSNPTTGVSQDKSIAPTAALLMEVVPPINVTFPPVRTVCEGEPVDINITVTPAGTTLEWDSDNQEVEVHSADGLAISVTPVHSSPGIARQIKAYKAVASNEYCNPKTVQTSVAVDKPITGEIVAKDSICQFDAIDLDASSYMATSYEWTYDETGAVFNGPALSLVPEPYYANFSLHMERGECVLDTFKFVEVTTAPLVMTVDSLDYRKVEIVLESGAGSAPFQFIIDGNTEDPYLNEAIRDNLTYTTHSLKVVDKVGCVTETTFSIKEPKIIIPIIVSPDENGVNDKFVVKGLAEGYPDAKVTIFDRWGKQLATYKAGDDVDWDGIYNGHPMPSTDYWYEIQIKEIKKTYTGHFTLIRQ